MDGSLVLSVVVVDVLVVYGELIPARLGVDNVALEGDVGVWMASREATAD